LGEVPLTPELRIQADEGRVMEAFDEPNAAPYLEAICQTFVGNLVAKQRQHPVMPSLPILK